MRAPPDNSPGLTTMKLSAHELLNTAVTENGPAPYLCASVVTDGQGPRRMICVRSSGFSLASPKIIYLLVKVLNLSTFLCRVPFQS